ncbi:MAG: stage II sporulation protein M, partial [Bacteroidota bacterium]
MREPTFFEQNKAKWARYEKNLAVARELNPLVLARQYEALLADLAHARTFYPQSDLVQSLNALCTQTHWAIYRNQSKTRVGWWAFWMTDLPLVLYRLRRYLLYAGLIFLLSVAIGWFGALEDMGFIRMVLGNDYVDMTMENIDAGDPMGVYKGESSFPMFLRIALNNLLVAFLVFALGSLAGVGTLMGLPFPPFNLQTGLFFNGVMVGAFMGIFHSQGLSTEALPVIYIHGTLELSAIVIAGGAGLAVGANILIPRVHSRWHAMRAAAVDGF